MCFVNKKLIQDNCKVVYPPQTGSRIVRKKGGGEMESHSNHFQIHLNVKKNRHFKNLNVEADLERTQKKSQEESRRLLNSHYVLFENQNHQL